MYPSLSEYNTDIAKYGGKLFTTLANIEFIPSRTVPVKIYSYGTGSYAVVFKAKKSENVYAIRCFISSNPEVLWRYNRIDNYLKQIQEKWVTKFDFIDNEIKIKENNYPIVKMEWVEGQLLNLYISSILFDNVALDILQKEIVELSDSLENNKVGHGDIQCGNIIIQGTHESPVIRLIDYDGMYIPEFNNKINLERGRAEFQHPNREYIKFDEKIDRFSFWVILCALEALKFNKEFWKESTQGGYNSLDNLLFTSADFKNFSTSKLVNNLYSLNIDSVNFYLNKLNKFCLSSELIIDKPSIYDKNSILPEVQDLIYNTSNIELININSFPIGANILNENFIRIGQTPLTLKKDKVINQRVILSYGTKIKTFLINNESRDIFFQFNELEKVEEFIPTILTGGDNETDYTILAQTQNISKPKDISNYSALIYGLLILVAIFVIGLFLNNKRETANTSSVNDVVVDTAAAVVLDTLGIIKVDTASVTEQTFNYFNELDEKRQKPKDVVNDFFQEIANADFLKAWDLTFDPIWEKKEYSWFVSTEQYGGIIYSEIKSINEKSQSNGSVEFIVSFFQKHVYNGELCFKQLIRVEKRNVNIGNKEQNLWMITKTKNLVEPYFCTGN